MRSVKQTKAVSEVKDELRWWGAAKLARRAARLEKWFMIDEAEKDELWGRAAKLARRAAKLARRVAKLEKWFMIYEAELEAMSDNELLQEYAARIADDPITLVAG